MDETDETAKPKYDGETLTKQGNRWLERIIASEKREKDWRDAAEAAEKAYSCDTKAKKGRIYDFNILHSNVETIVPAIYNSTPIPDIRRRFVEALGKPPEPPQPAQPPQAAQPGQPPVAPPQPDPRAMAQYQQDLAAFQQKKQADKDARDFGAIIERVITVQIDDNRLDAEIEANAQDAFLAGRGVVRLRLEVDAGADGGVSNERITFEAVSWRDYRQGPAKRWGDVPWISFRHSLPREELEEFSDRELVAAYPAGDGAAASSDDDDDDITFWEVWSRKDRKVYFVRSDDGKIIKIEDDPLQLPGFYPVSQPIQPISVVGKTTPVCPFTVYKKLADELDTITKRINKIMDGLKVRGIVAGDASSLLSLADADDNEIVVETNLEQLAQTGGLDKAIAWWPVETAVRVLKELYVQRESTKSSIYEVTGISDIVRGASNAGETATAQNIKNQWGSLRIQKMQRMIERQVRDLFVMMSDIIVSKFSEPSLREMTGIEINDGIRAMMARPVSTSYRIDVESDSTVRADLTRQKQDMTEFVQGTAAYFNVMGPLVQQTPQAAEPVARIYSSMARVFKLGRDAETALDELVDKAAQAASQPPKPNPEQEKLKAEMELKKAEFQMKAQSEQQSAAMKAEADQRKAAMDAETDQRKIGIEQQKAGIDLQVAQTNLQIKQVELKLKEQEAGLKLQTQQASTAMKLDAQRQANEMKAEQVKEPADA